MWLGLNERDLDNHITGHYGEDLEEDRYPQLHVAGEKNMTLCGLSMFDVEVATHPTDEITCADCFDLVYAKGLRTV